MSKSDPKKVLVTICSKNPSYYNLSTNIQYFQKFLENYDYLISIVDSDLKNNTTTYNTKKKIV